MKNDFTQKTVTIGSLFLFLAVLFGAFGAHGLEKIVSADKLSVFETGVRYQFYHGFAIILTGIIYHMTKIELNKVVWFFGLGIVLFSFDCYLYVITGIKTFAMIVPIGGTMFLIGWFMLFVKSIKGK